MTRGGRGVGVVGVPEGGGLRALGGEREKVGVGAGLYLGMKEREKESRKERKNSLSIPI